ncbi:helix-turn-helix domain-containing protein [Pedobacter sp. AW31-3R]|uniref:helix-turn-helix domain-containing protein n=1 Tax=Pedobacter sp. AW31-3R TaxID=3445781 RepID=UPI003FA07E43
MRGFKKKELLTSTDLAKLFQKSSRTIRRWRDRGILTKNKIGGGYFYRWDDIQSILRELKDKRYK